MIASLIERFRSLESEWKLLGLVVLLTAMMVWPPAPLSFTDAPDPDQVVRLDPRLTALPEGVTLTTEGRVTRKEDGFLFEDATARLVLLVDGGIDRARVSVDLYSRPESRWTVRVARGFQGRVIPRVIPGESIVVEGEEMPGEFGTGQAYSVAIAPAPESQPGMLLKGAHVRASVYTSQDRLPSAPGFLLAPLVPLGLSLFLIASGRQKPRVAVVLGGIFALLVGGALRLRPELADMVPVVTAALMLGVAGGCLTRGLRTTNDAALRRRLLLAAEIAGFVGIIAMGAVMRWEALMLERATLPGSDAIGFIAAGNNGSFYDTTIALAPYIREPLFPALIHYWGLIVPESITFLRLGTMLIGLVMVALIWLVGRGFFGPIAALLAAGWAATTPYLANLSVQILSDELLCVLLLALLAVPSLLGQSRARSAVFGLAWGAMALVRLNFLVLVFPLLIIEGIRRRWHPAEWVLATVLAVVPVIPHLTENARVSGGDHFFSSNVAYRSNANLDHIGEPGWPATFDEWSADPFSGDPMTTGEFLGLYSPGELAVRIAGGYFHLYVRQFPHGELFRGNEIIMVFGLVGLVVWWRRRRELWWLPPAFIWLTLPAALVVSITLDNRLAVPAVPIILWTWGAGVSVVIGLLADRWGMSPLPEDPVPSP